MSNIKDYFQLRDEELGKKMEVYDKLNNAIDNYLNVASRYGFDDPESIACLCRGVRNAFMLGEHYEYERFKKVMGM